MRVNRTSDVTTVSIGRMAEDSARSYPGDTADAELAMRHRSFERRFHKLIGELAIEQTVLERSFTIQLGTHSADALRKALTDADITVTDLANDILENELATEPQEVTLVIVTVAELGFPNGANREEIYTRGLKRGFKLCPSEVGPQLRLQRLNQPVGEWLSIAMRSVFISSDDRIPKVFNVTCNNDGLYLSGCKGNFDKLLFWEPDDLWVFRLNNQEQ